jgi:hypothetical protein
MTLGPHENALKGLHYAVVKNASRTVTVRLKADTTYVNTSARRTSG